MKINTIFFLVVTALTAVLLTFPTVSMANEVSSAASTVADAAGKGGIAEKININTASMESLAAIPGIGPKISESIAAYREANGAFSKIADLVNVEGIDASLVEKIAPFLSI